jgi:hypothetical protein
MVSTLSGLMLCGLLAARMTSAQGPGGPPPDGPGGPPGGPGGVGRFMPFAAGTISAIDPNTGKIALQTQFGGNARTIQVTNNTQFVTQMNITAADLQVNDQVQVQGVPTGITASSLTAGQMPDFLPGGGRFRPGGPPNIGNPGGSGAGAAPAFASATGRVTATNPLTISLSNNVSLTVKLAPNARVSKIAPMAFNNLKIGDRVIASGQAGNDGSFMATGVAVNMEMAGPFGPGGFGRGGFRQRGFGGPGGPPGPDGAPPPPADGSGAPPPPPPGAPDNSGN